jgi:hypothetical protein
MRAVTSPTRFAAFRRMHPSARMHEEESPKYHTLSRL